MGFNDALARGPVIKNPNFAACFSSVSADIFHSRNSY